MSKISLINSTTYETTLKGGDKVEIGDKSTSKFKPHIKLNRWGGECFIKCSIPDDGHSFLVLEQDKVKWVNSKVESHFIPSDKKELGEFAWDIVLKKKPTSNVLTWKIESQGLKFYYQPALTQQEIDEGADRPENVVGSYAIYHATRSNMHAGKADADKYKCGKAFHIYRPKVHEQDNESNWIWGELNIDEEKGILSVSVEQDWLDNAVYPVVIDPNFGFDVKGGTISRLNTYSYGCKFQIPEAGTAQSISFYIIHDEQDNTGYALYDVSYNLLASIKPVVINIYDDFLTGNLSTTPSLTQDSYYWLVASKTEGGTDPQIFYDAGVAGQASYDDLVYASFPEDPWTPVGDGWAARKYSTYCTYEAGGFDTPTVTTQAVTDIAQTTATGHGNITNTGGEDCHTRGICWSINPNPTTADDKAEDNGGGAYGTGAFSKAMTGLSSDTHYYVRAYAINSDSTGYGSDVEFDTLAVTAKVVDITYLTPTSGYIWYVELSGPNFEDDDVLNNGGGDEITINGTPAADTTFYETGEIEMTSGVNNGQQRPVALDSAGVITVLWPFVSAVAMADSYNLYPGCDLRGITCHQRFNNADFFRGFRYVPRIEDTIM